MCGLTLHTRFISLSLAERLRQNRRALQCSDAIFLLAKPDCDYISAEFVIYFHSNVPQRITSPPPVLQQSQLLANLRARSYRTEVCKLKVISSNLYSVQKTPNTNYLSRPHKSSSFLSHRPWYHGNPDGGRPLTRTTLQSRPLKCWELHANYNVTSLQYLRRKNMQKSEDFSRTSPQRAKGRWPQFTTNPLRKGREGEKWRRREGTMLDASFQIRLWHVERSKQLTWDTRLCTPQLPGEVVSINIMINLNTFHTSHAWLQLKGGAKSKCNWLPVRAAWHEENRRYALRVLNVAMATWLPI